MSNHRRKLNTEAQRVAVNHQRIVTAAAQILAHRRWGHDDLGQQVFEQLALWPGNEDQVQNQSQLTIVS